MRDLLEGLRVRRASTEPDEAEGYIRNGVLIIPGLRQVEPEPEDNGAGGVPTNTRPGERAKGESNAQPV